METLVAVLDFDPAKVDDGELCKSFVADGRPQMLSDLHAARQPATSKLVEQEVSIRIAQARHSISLSRRNASADITFPICFAIARLSLDPQGDRA